METHLNHTPQLNFNYKILFKVFITSVLIGMLIFNSNNEQLFSLFKDIRAVFIILACFSFVFGIFINTKRLQYLFNQKQEIISYGKLLRINFIGLFFSIFLPGRTVGDFVRGYYLAKAVKPISVVVSTFLIWRLIGVFAMLFIACTASIMSYRILEDFSLIYYSMGTLIIFLFCLALLFNPSFFKPMYRLKIIQRIVPKKFAGMVEKILKSLNTIRNQKLHISKNIIYSLLSNFFILLTWYSLSISINANISLIYFLIFIPLISLLQAIPISFNGIGVREGMTVFFFSSVGIANEIPFTIAILYSALSVTVSLLGGLIYLSYKNEKQLEI